MFNKEIIKCNEGLLISMLGRGLIRELCTFLLLKRLFESGFIRHYLRTELPNTSRATLYRHVKVLMDEGLIRKFGDSIMLMGSDKIAVKYNNKKFWYYEKENLEYSLKKRRVKICERRQEFVLREHKDITGKRVNKYYGGNYVCTTSDASADINLSNLGIAKMFGLDSVSGGANIFRQLAKDVTRVHRVDADKRLYLPCTLEVKPIKDARVEHQKELTVDLRGSFSYCANDCIGW